MEVFPDEYLPDDYTGPSAGPLQQIIGTYSHISGGLEKWEGQKVALFAWRAANFQQGTL